MTTWFSYNETRQCSYIFGIDAVHTFLKKNNLVVLIRGHTMHSDGYNLQMVDDQTQTPRVITVYSAPGGQDYAFLSGNKGAILKLDDEQLNIRQFGSSPHPYYLPDFMDLFSWSLPFVLEKVTEILHCIVSYERDDVDESAGPDAFMNSKKKNNNDVLKGKVAAVAKLMRMYKVLQENQENIIKLKQLSPNGHLPCGVLAGGRKSIEKAISSFSDAKAADKVNEALPGQNMMGKQSPKGQLHYSHMEDEQQLLNSKDDGKSKTTVKITTDE